MIKTVADTKISVSHFQTILTLLITLFLLGTTSVHSQDIYLIPTLHRLHQTNEAYNYDSLRQTIACINPDIIAVEIRREDLNEDTTYLKGNYPYEMWMARYWFSNKTITGFDWLGSDIEGKRIPENYWQEISPIKLLQKALNNDSTYKHAADTCAVFANERMTILKSFTLPSLLKSRDAALANQYYECLEVNLKNTPYTGIPSFFEQRNQKILSNLEAIRKRYPNKKIVVLTGADHYAFLKERMKHVPLP